MPIQSQRPFKASRAGRTGDRVADRNVYQQGYDAFHEQLRHLLDQEEDAGKWVAFYGPRRIAVSDDRDGLYDLAQAEVPGLKLEDLFISQIAPEQESLEGEMFQFR